MYVISLSVDVCTVRLIEYFFWLMYCYFVFLEAFLRGYISACAYRVICLYALHSFKIAPCIWWLPTESKKPLSERYCASKPTIFPSIVMVHDRQYLFNNFDFYLCIFEIKLLFLFLGIYIYDFPQGTLVLIFQWSLAVLRIRAALNGRFCRIARTHAPECAANVWRSDLWWIFDCVVGQTWGPEENGHLRGPGYSMEPEIGVPSWSTCWTWRFFHLGFLS